MRFEEYTVRALEAPQAAQQLAVRAGHEVEVALEAARTRNHSSARGAGGDGLVFRSATSGAAVS